MIDLNFFLFLYNVEIKWEWKIMILVWLIDFHHHHYWINQSFFLLTTKHETEPMFLFFVLLVGCLSYRLLDNFQWKFQMSEVLFQTCFQPRWNHLVIWMVLEWLLFCKICFYIFFFFCFNLNPPVYIRIFWFY